MSDVAAVQEGGTIDVTVTPEHMELPSERTTIRIDPMRQANGPFLIYSLHEVLWQ